jgi:anti-sigma B factor antagonist
MNIERTDIGLVSIIRMPTQLTLGQAAAWRHAIRDVIDMGYHRLVLDMSGVEFIDSTGLSVLVATLKACRAEGGEVVLLGLTPPVRALVELTRLHHVFEIFRAEEAAVRHLEARQVA